MRSVLITGGTGTLGQALAKALEQNERFGRIVIFSRGEHAQEQMAHRFASDKMRFFIGDCRDRDRLQLAMQGVTDVIHAAALKIVPTAEYNPFEAVRTNVLGAQNVIEAALRSSSIRRVVNVSTDKAVSPINLYGATKLCAEKLFVAANVYSGGTFPTFSIVRYGNVSGSQGSVIPLWYRLIREGKAVIVTDTSCTRFWLEIPQAVNAVLWALDHAISGEIVVPEMPAYEVRDLILAMEACPSVTGLRPGEKRHETIINEHEAHKFYRYGDYWLTRHELHRTQLSTPLSSDQARRMSVSELQSRLSAIGFPTVLECAA